jgi:hypothetical protein
MTEQNEFWPGGARLAVSVSMQFEAGGQPVSGAGGPITEPILPGFPDLGQNTFYEYGQWPRRSSAAATRLGRTAAAGSGSIS